MRNLAISRYKSRFDKGKQLKVQHSSWEDVRKLLSNFKVTNETFAEYQGSESLVKLGIKDTGYFVGGLFDPPLRKTFNLQYRSILTLDLDHMESWDIDEIKATFGKYEYFVHSSHSHSEDSPRLRLVFPLTRDVTPEEYEALARMVANMLDMDMFDDTTYQFSRIMFLPSVSSDGEKYLESNHGEWLDPDYVLGLYEDWNDFGSWPRSSRQDFVRPSASRAEDPFTKPGIIGAFNRAYSIPEAIAAFDLPYEDSGQGDGRYSYTGGTSADGAVYYPDDGHLYSHHESDPAHGNQCAFDLVRLHRFGAAAEGATHGMSEPTMQHMVLLASTDPECTREMAVDLGFEDCTEEAEQDSETGAILPPVPKVEAITDQDIIDWISKAYNTPELETGVAMDTFISMVTVANLPSGKTEQLIGLMQEYLKSVNVKISKQGFLKDIKAYSKDLVSRGSEGQELKDIQVEFLKEFLDQYYVGGKHLKRTGKQFWTFNGTHWVQRHDEYIQGQLIDTLIQLRTDAKTRKRRKELAAAVGESQTSSIQASLWSMFQAMTTFDTESKGVESDPMGLMRTNLPPAINCANGTLIFRADGKHKLVDSNPADLFTSVIDVPYDPKAECPVWNSFCQTTFCNTTDAHDMQRHLEEVIGYTINQSRDLRAWVLMYGGTGTGKSTVGKVLDYLLGDSAKNMSMGNYVSGGNSHATAGLIGKQMLLDDDYGTGQLLNDGFLKSISEEKRMEANPKGREEFPFVARVVPFILSNSQPATKDTSGALADRALVFPFSHAVPRASRDTRLPQKLKEELPGILARCVRAYGQLVKRGDWLFPADCTTAWSRWIDQSNPLQLFVSDCMTEEAGGIVKASDLWDAYRSWWREETGSDHNAAMGRRNTFYAKLEQTLGAPSIHHRELGKAWRGWALDSRFITDTENWDD
jgi:P4 family phage/plasmid primase-like protien